MDLCLYIDSCNSISLSVHHTSHRVCHCSTPLPALLGTDTRRLFRVPSVTQSGSMWSCRYQHVSCRHRTQTPLNPFKGHESRRSDLLFTNPTYGIVQYILSPAPLFAAPKKSNSDASQLAPSVPLSSYRGAAECAGWKR